MRVETSLFISGIALSGYLIFNAPASQMLFLFLTVFFASGASYAHNHITDKEEDSVNNEKLNIFAIKNSGRLIVISLIAFSVLSAYLLFNNLTVSYIVLLFTSMFYSLSKIKKIYMIKNIYTGLAMMIVFLFGATAKVSLNKTLFMPALIIFLFGFLLNLLGDIRGYAGDKKVGMKTIPILLGIKKAKTIVYLLISTILIMIIGSKLTIFYSLIPFSLMIAFFLKHNKPKATRLSILFSFITLPMVIILFG